MLRLRFVVVLLPTRVITGLIKPIARSGMLMAVALGTPSPVPTITTQALGLVKVTLGVLGNQHLVRVLMTNTHANLRTTPTAVTVLGTSPTEIAQPITEMSHPAQ